MSGGVLLLKQTYETASPLLFTDQAMLTSSSLDNYHPGQAIQNLVAQGVAALVGI